MNGASDKQQGFLAYGVAVVAAVVLAVMMPWWVLGYSRLEAAITAFTCMALLAGAFRFRILPVILIGLLALGIGIYTTDAVAQIRAATDQAASNLTRRMLEYAIERDRVTTPSERWRIAWDQSLLRRIARSDAAFQALCKAYQDGRHAAVLQLLDDPNATLQFSFSTGADGRASVQLVPPTRTSPSPPCQR